MEPSTETEKEPEALVQSLRYLNGSWEEQGNSWNSLLDTFDGGSTEILFASLKDVARTSPSVRVNIFANFQLPDFLLERPYSEANGYCGRKLTLTEDGALEQYSHWTRVIVKQTGKSLRPRQTFVEHDSLDPEAPPPKAAGAKAQHAERASVPVSDHFARLHDLRTAHDGWEWYEMVFAVRWSGPSSSTKIVCFDVPPHLCHAIKAHLKQLPSRVVTKQHGPYELLAAAVLKPLMPVLDKSVWAIRDHICAWESHRETNVNYGLIHEIARHAVHVSETLEVAARSLSGLRTHHAEFFERHASRRVLGGGGGPSRDWDATADVLELQTQTIQNLLSRSRANEARIQNEITLAFHLAAQRDSHLQVRMSRDVQRETVAMRILSVIAVAFLPATFVCSIFGTAFFEFIPDESASGLAVSDKFWLLWVTSVPLSALAVTVWAYFDSRMRARWESQAL